jgi:L-threonylcarbamoyladenylate synthase
MKPLHIHIRSKNNGSDWIGPVLSILSEGGVVAYPTETVYGLGGDAENDAVAERIHRLKQRESRKPYLTLFPDSSTLLTHVKHVTPQARKLMDRFWPGPLTLIFNVTTPFPELLLGDGNTLGARVSSDPICQILLNHFQKPMISTSANPDRSKPARSVPEVQSYFPRGLDAILDGGPREDASPSTVLDVTGEIPFLLRRGAVSKKAIVNVIGEIREE